MHHCESCPGSAALKKFRDELSHLDMDSEIHYCQRQTTDHAAMATLITTFEEYKELLIDNINNLTWNLYLAKAQAKYVKSKKESLSANEVTVLGHFTENYQYLIQDELQSFHWSKEYCTLHPLVIYYKDADSLFHFRWQHTEHQLCSNNSDTTGGILEAQASESHKDLYISDGCGGQYKNFKNCLNWCSEMPWVQNEVCRGHSTT